MKTWNKKCSNKAECNNGIPLKVTNQTDPSIKKRKWDIDLARVVKLLDCIFSDRMTNLFTHIDKCLLKWIWFNTNRRYKWHCCLLLFLAWLITESVYNDAFRTFTFLMQQCIVYMTKKIRIILINVRFQIGNDRQSKRLLANLGRILFFSFFFWDKN